ncbi:hypothetical protein ACWOKN_004323 [Vibrio vulnificus]|nr:hypothetical protein [Vibrio vulnificus]EHH0850179.1 hypothetical protein [Vibrio vulnificus]EHU5129700.1 hypothetical protein [Vibrio vulnificus]
MNFFSNNFKIFWWGFIVITLGFYFWQRFPELALGNAVTADMLVFIVWIAVCLVPFFNQFEFLGLKLKAQMEETKKELQGQINTLRNEVSNSNNVDVKPNFWVGSAGLPASDEKLMEMEQKLDLIVKATEVSFGYNSRSTNSISVDSDVLYLFETRYQIEFGLRKLARVADVKTSRRGLVISRLVYELVEHELLPAELAEVAREVYAICSPAVHGDTDRINLNQIEFVKRVSPELISVINGAIEKFV